MRTGVIFFCDIPDVFSALGIVNRQRSAIFLNCFGFISRNFFNHSARPAGINLAEKYPESVKAIADAGHDVGNHSNTHPHLPKMEKDKILAQIEDCNKKIEAAGAPRPILFRPPYGDYNNCVVESTNELKMHCIQWDVDSLDWKDPTPDDMVKRIKSKLKPGSIILMHNGAKNTPEALPKIIDMIKGEGYQIVPISEIIYKENYTMDSQGKQKLNK